MRLLDPALDQSRGRSLDVPCDLLSVAIVRQRMADHLLGLSCDERLVRDAATVVSELLMNAIVHGAPDAGGHVQVAWAATDDGLDVVVRDHGSTGRPHVEAPDDDAAGGRGLQLVQRLSREWSVDDPDGGAGTTVRVRLAT